MKADDPTRRRRLRVALRLEVVTVAYNVGEAAVALLAGWWAGSLALVGFGLDSIIEVVAATAVGRRLLHEIRGATAADTRARDRRALRIVGVTFFLLAAYIAIEATQRLIRVETPAISPVGLALALLSLLAMPALAWGKLRLGRALGSPALMADARETFACVYLSLTLLAGLGLNALLGWWWADSMAALAMIPYLTLQGWEALSSDA